MNKSISEHRHRWILPRPTIDERVISATAWSLLRQGDLPDQPVRLIGARLSGWEEPQAVQADLFDLEMQQRQDDSILKTIDAVTEKFGNPLLGVGLSRPGKSD